MQEPNIALDTIGPREREVLVTLLKFTLGMVIVPISAFFFSKWILFEAFLGYSNGAIGAAIITVVIIHIIIFMYIVVAIKEEPVKKQE
ncbi:hypothetical protein QZH41_012785 [Actinostola sp. cb2023]|nr:hypothetical protein QZH41_012785 [Actinostola sp. cb2023]